MKKCCTFAEKKGYEILVPIFMLFTLFHGKGTVIGFSRTKFAGIVFIHGGSEESRPVFGVSLAT